jgi:NADH:ubiquinone oxidoreductase subunit E
MIVLLSYDRHVVRVNMDQSSCIKQPSRQAMIRVCCGSVCCRHGSEKIFGVLEAELGGSGEAVVRKSSACFGHCADGPNVALNDNLLSGIKPFSAVEQVRAAMEDVSCKADGLGLRNIDDLDDILEHIDRI